MIDLYNLYYQQYLPPIKNHDAWMQYVNIVQVGLKRTSCRGLKEKHHIVPKCYLPVGISLEESFIGNKVILTPEEHYKAHCYLAKALDDNKMISAAKYMSHNYKYNKSSYFEEENEVLHKKQYRPKLCPYKRYWKKK